MLSRALVSMLPLVPRPVVWRISRRYIAGEGLEDALDVVAELNRHGISGTIDLLGEDSRSEAEARGSLEIYLRGLDEIARREIDCNISVKLSQMGLRFDEGLCRAILRELLEAAEARRNFIRIDMEDSSVTGVTLEIYRELRAGSSAIGAVIQAYLRRSRADIESLLDAPANVRLCKGIYREPAAIAFQDRKEIRDSFTELLELLFSAGARRVGIATHDAPLIDRARKMIQKDEIPAERYEFQMLLGVTEALRDELVAAGHPLRVYVPFGREWYAYSSRRLRENPQIAGHIVRNLFRPGA